MSKKHFCDRCKKELGEAESFGYTFRLKAWVYACGHDVEFCRKCADEVWLFMHGEEVVE